jgi:hypothetical protein
MGADDTVNHLIGMIDDQAPRHPRPRRLRLGFTGSRSPSSRQSRCTRLRLQAQPSRRRIAWIRR